jgi:hypothetical protein
MSKQVLEGMSMQHILKDPGQAESFFHIIDADTGSCLSSRLKSKA